MSSLLAPDRRGWGIQLPVQSLSTRYAAPWEADAGPRELASIARAADGAGATYVGVCDHVAIPDHLAADMGVVWYDTVATIGWLAAQTTRVHLLSHVYVVPYRSALVVANSFSTLDALSGGRVVLGVGAGHVEREFEMLGVDFGTRGARLDEQLGVIREVFDTGTFDGASIAPRPSRPGGPPIWVGGSSMPAMRRAARLGDGWLPQGPPEMGMRAAVEFLIEERATHRPDADPLDIGTFTEPIHVGTPSFDVPDYALTGAPDRIAERLRRYLASGVHQMQPRFLAAGADEVAEQLLRFGAEVWPLVVEG